MKDRILEKMKGTFNPEFLNRLDETIVYHPLTKNNVMNIIDLQLMDLHENLDKLGFTLSVTKKAKSLILEKGFNLEYGVRFLRREIQNLLEDPLSELLLSKALSNAKGIKVDVIQKEFKFLPVTIKTRKKPSKKSKSSSGKKPVKPIDS